MCSVFYVGSLVDCGCGRSGLMLCAGCADRVRHAAQGPPVRRCFAAHSSQVPPLCQKSPHHLSAPLSACLLICTMNEWGTHLQAYPGRHLGIHTPVGLFQSILSIPQEVCQVPWLCPLNPPEGHVQTDTGAAGPAGFPIERPGQRLRRGSPRG